MSKIKSTISDLIDKLEKQYPGIEEKLKEFLVNDVCTIPDAQAASCSEGNIAY